MPISKRQSAAMLFIFFVTSTIASNSGLEAGRDSWIAGLFSLILAIPLLLIYYEPFRIHKGKSIFEINSLIYGKILGVVLNIIMILAVILVSTMSFSKYVIFIKTVALQNSSIYLIGIFMVITVIYATYKGIISVARASEIAVWVVISFLLFTLIVTFSNLNFLNLTPILEFGLNPIITGTYSILATPFMESFALIALISTAKNTADLRKTIISIIIVSCILMSVTFMRDLLILGFPAIKSLYYPSYSAISLVNLGDFFQRQEVVVSISFLIGDILKISTTIIFITDGLKYLFKKNFIIPSAILVFVLSTTFFKSSLDLFGFFEIYKYILIFPFILLPLTTFLVIYFKKILKKSEI